MDQEIAERVREAAMDTLREWGGQWNVSPVAPGTGDAPHDRWLLRVHSRPITRGTLSAETVEAYLDDPSDPAAAARWEAELRPVFEAAKAVAP